MRVLINVAHRQAKFKSFCLEKLSFLPISNKKKLSNGIGAFTDWYSNRDQAKVSQKLLEISLDIGLLRLTSHNSVTIRAIPHI